MCDFPNEFSPQSVADCICYWSLSLSVLNFTTPRLNVGQQATRIDGYPRNVFFLAQWRWIRQSWAKEKQVTSVAPSFNQKKQCLPHKIISHHAGNDSKKSQPPN
uniref:Uncharacterized protein n=1 Tax=Glossina pallidipes TaxID=7398 RepID=A0A1A9ZBD7_GLOPL